MEPKIKCAHTAVMSLEDLQAKMHPANENKHTKKQIEVLAKIIVKNGQRSPVVVSKRSGYITKGHGRVGAMMLAGYKTAAVDVQDYDSDLEEFNDRVADNEIARYAEFNELQFKENLEQFDIDIAEIDFEEFGLIDFSFDDDNDDGDYKPIPMSEQFLAPPFSILDARQGYWLERKRWWIDFGIKSEEGRDAKAFSTQGRLSDQSDTSIFDPVLSELLVSWFSKKDDLVLDPFAGGSVRGVVTSILERSYHGCDLRQVQVDANIKQAKVLCEYAKLKPSWVCGDSTKLVETFKGKQFNFMFSCPPYADLEIYSNDPADISNMEYSAFLDAYQKIIKNCYELLEQDTFACFVIGEVRSKSGNYYNFVGDTITAFIKAGFSYYNEITYITPTGSLPMRAGKTFKASRKVGKAHQNVLVFVKGDGKLAAERLGDVEIFKDDSE